MSGPLEGTRVVELATGIQGPGAGLHFASMGADVVKVESPMGDLNRYYLADNSDQLGTQFLAMNKGKRSVTLDLHTELGRRVMHELLAGSDVFVTNFRATALTRMGLELHALVERHPKLVVGHVNGFGPLGADADKAMLDGAAQARGGLVSLSGPEDGPPMPPGVTLADHAGAMQLALASVTALVARGRTGRGQLVQTSSLGGQLWLQAWELQHSALSGERLARAGAHHPAIKAPYGVYATADDVPVAFITAMTDDAWTAFWLFVDRPEALLLEAWDTPGKRMGRYGSEEELPEIRQLMREAFRSKPFAGFEAFFATQPEIIWERVRSHDQVLSDPQNLANGYVVELELPKAGTTRTLGPLMAFSDTPPPPVALPPELGADTGAVMAALGFDASEVEEVTTHASNVHREMLVAFFGEE